MAIGWDLPRSAASVLLTVRLGEEHGASAETLLAGTGLSAADLRDPATEVTGRLELQVVRNLLAALPHIPALGLAAGQRYHLTTYGIWGFALISSSTLREAVDVALRHLDLTYAFCEITAEEVGDELVLRLDASAVPADVRLFAVERDAAALRVVGSELTGATVPLTRVTTAYAAPPWAAAYAPVFGVEPVFDTGHNVAVIDGALADLPLPQADELTAASALAACRDLLERRRSRTGLAGRVRDQLLRDPAEMPSVTEVAAALHLSERSLRRHLTGEGA